MDDVQRTGVTEGASTPGGPDVDDPARVLRAVEHAVRLTGDQALLVLSPVRDPGGRIVDFRLLVDSGIISRLTGRDTVNRTLREVLPAPAAEGMIAGYVHVLSTGTVVREDLTLAVTASGVVPTLAGQPGPAEDPARADEPRLGQVIRVATDDLVVVLGRDVTEERAAEHALAASEQRYRRLVEHSSDPILVVGADGRLTYSSPAVRSVLHRDPDALVGRTVHVLTHPDDAPACAELVQQVAADPSGASRMAHVRTQHPGGDVGWVSVTATNWLDDPAVGGVVLNVRDITEQRAAEQRLQVEALQDPLTGLPNRRWFLRALREAAGRHDRTGAPFAVLVLDVDDFKSVNDTRGHPAGDDLLRQLADRLSSSLRPSDAAARLGGGEFVVVAEALHGPADADRLARRVLERCTGTYSLLGSPVRVTVSVGVATSADVAAPSAVGDAAPGSRHGSPALDPEGVLTLADAALYEAKRRGRNRIERAAESVDR